MFVHFLENLVAKTGKTAYPAQVLVVTLNRQNFVSLARVVKIAIRLREIILRSTRDWSYGNFDYARRLFDFHFNFSVRNRVSTAQISKNTESIVSKYYFDELQLNNLIQVAIKWLWLALTQRYRSIIDMMQCSSQFVTINYQQFPSIIYNL